MNDKDCNYKLWESEIFDFINKEIINYRSNDQREQIEYILKELKKGCLSIFLIIPIY